MRKNVGIVIGSALIVLGGFWFYQQAVTPKNVPVETNKAESNVTTKNNASKSKDGLPADATTDNPALVLVNKKHPLKAEIDFEKAEMQGVTYNALMKQSLTDFVNAATEAGYPVTIVSAYRSIAYQQTVIDTQVAQYLAQGDSEDEAMKKTFEYIQTPGASEHHTGLGVDIMANEYWDVHHALNPEADETKAQQWLIKHAPDYGFVLRYPKTAEGRESTGIAYESWHFRYVGVENAQYMAKNNLTLEQYWDLMNQNK